MEAFYRTHRYLVEHTDAPIRRGLMDEIDWNDRLIGIKGTRGVGKTTFLLQYAKEKFGKDCVTVFIAPCASKKAEGFKDENVDFVLTFREIDAIIQGMGVDIESTLPYTPAESACKDAHNFAGQVLRSPPGWSRSPRQNTLSLETGRSLSRTTGIPPVRCCPFFAQRTAETTTWQH